MAKAKRKRSGVWGIDIGQCSVKALRCEIGEDEETIVADAFDYIEYPKVLSQPEADPIELIREALEQFLSRNDVQGDKIAMSVAGQAGLSRFFKPPPVDAKMISDIVKYEARQQIPFALEDVIWDFQLIGGTEVDGFVMDAEVGIFAMKRDAVFKALQPFLDADVEIDIVQLAPLSIYNVVCYDVLKDVPAPEDIDPDNPPESLVVVAMGTETTDLVITNGNKLWQRNIPLGGNHFTKQLTKELKLTYAKAEHLKRNARQAEDPKTVFQVMRPIFNDLVTEIQRSVGFFQSIDRQAKIGRMVMLGNAVKLPGLRQYLSKNLGQEAIKVESYDRLTGSAVIESKPFKDNVLSFSVCYGLCLQGLEQSSIRTNLLPREFITERLIREKKPWAVASLGALLLAFSFNYYFHFDAWNKVHPDRTDEAGNWTSTAAKVETMSKKSSDLMSRDKNQLAELAHVKSLGEEVVGNGDRQVSWLEMMKAVLAAIPQDPRYEPGAMVNAKDIPYLDREDMQIQYVESEYFPDLKAWFTDPVKDNYVNDLMREAEAEPVDGDPAPAPTAENVKGPDGAGWVIELGGYHYHNSGPGIKDGWGAAYVRNKLIKNLRDGQVTLPGENGAPTVFTFEELGISLPVLISNQEVDRKNTIPNPNHPENMKGNRSGRAESDSAEAGEPDKDEEKVSEPLEFPAPRYDFVVQFVWQEKLLSQRLEEKKKKEEELRKLHPVQPEGEATVAGADGSESGDAEGGM